MTDFTGIDGKKTAPKLAKILEKEGLRQAELSRDCGVRHETLNRLIKGKQEVGTVTQYKILKSLIRLTGNPSYTIEAIFE